jgi:hypothetical protein
MRGGSASRAGAVLRPWPGRTRWRGLRDPGSRDDVSGRAVRSRSRMFGIKADS